MKLRHTHLLLSLASLLALGNPAPAAAALPTAAETADASFAIGKGTFLLKGQPFTVKAAELHYPRIPRDYWEHRIKMCKALGMNTICLYVFWNIHEQREGEFDFTGNNDVAAFCRLAQKHGMYVIVRPGPYVCAEWEMGGLPWWLLKKKDIKLRDNDAYYLERVGIFEEKVAEQLAPLTIDKGGPIIMVQVENEYGAYARNKEHVAAIRDMLRKHWGQDVVLFQCDWASTFEVNGLDDLVWTMNFGTGSNIDDQFRRLKEVRPDTPLMCSEFWSGWFDKWGTAHETRAAEDMVAGISEMLDKGISFSLYMTHGGTSFGHWAGANSPGIAPDVTSYDYDAPIGEYGQATPKYHLLRECLSHYTSAPLPAVPSLPAPLITLPRMELEEYAPITLGIDSISASGPLLTFEDMDMGWGSMLYATTLPADFPASTLEAEVHDYGIVFLNGRQTGIINRVKNETTLSMPAVKAGDKLEILVEGMGRINFGWGIKDYKGIVSPLTLKAASAQAELTLTPKVWTCATLPDAYEDALRALESGKPKAATTLPTKAGYYRGYFNVKKPGDTFLNMELWGKGQVYVNGHAIGRFWNIGPQQTLYLPGCWLKKGRNEVIVLDVEGPSQAIVWGESHPILDQLQPSKRSDGDGMQQRPDLSSQTPCLRGTLQRNASTYQTLRFGQPARGRYVAFLMTSTHDGKPATIAELYLQDGEGKRVNRTNWHAMYVSSETLQGNHTADKAFDLQESTHWQALPAGEEAAPTMLVIDLGEETTIGGLEYMPQMGNKSAGCVRECEVYVF